MRSKRQHYGMKASKKFGKDLRRWRDDKGFTQDEAARKLGLNMKNPGAYLSMIENGERPIPHVALSNVAQVYDRSPEEVMKKAYWPQLTFSIFDAVQEIDVSKAIDDYLAEISKQLDDKQKKELTQFATFLVVKSCGRR